MSKVLVIRDATPPTDYDGNIYSEVTINDVVWLVENLKTTHYADGSTIPFKSNSTEWNAMAETGEEGMAYYLYNEATYKSDYGALYSWNVTQKTLIYGYRVPTETELVAFRSFIGSNSGYSLQESGTTYWTNNNGTNIHGFNGRGSGGFGSPGNSVGIKTNLNLWSSTEGSSTLASRLLTTTASQTITVGGVSKTFGNSIRLIKT